jgi:hypothetical protein
MRALLFGFLLALASFGCATQRVTMEDLKVNETRLFVTRSGEDVTLSWESQAGMAYTILYNHTRSASSPWKVLPGFDLVRGTGRTLTYQDRVPVQEVRFYRLQTVSSISLPP